MHPHLQPNDQLSLVPCSPFACVWLHSVSVPKNCHCYEQLRHLLCINESHPVTRQWEEQCITHNTLVCECCCFTIWCQLLAWQILLPGCRQSARKGRMGVERACTQCMLYTCERVRGSTARRCTRAWTLAAYGRLLLPPYSCSCLTCCAMDHLRTIAQGSTVVHATYSCPTAP